MSATVSKQLWLVSETEKARLYASKPDGSGQFWVPRSVIARQLKWGTENGQLHPRCQVEIESWWLDKNNLL